MKRILSMLALAAISTSAYANILMPEISRDGKTRNRSVLAVAQQDRNFIGADTGVLTIGANSAGVEADYNTFNLYGGFTNGAFTLEANRGSLDIESSNGSRRDTDSMNLLMGYRFSDDVAFGFGFLYQDLTETVDDSALELGIAIKSNGYTFGASVAFHVVSATLAEGGYNELKAAIGDQDKDYSWEAGLYYLTAGDEDYNGGVRYGIFGSITKIMNNIELDARLRYLGGDYLDVTTNADNDYSNIILSFDAEFLFDRFYLTPGLEYASNDQPGTTSDIDLASVNALFGFRSNGLDANAGLSFIYSSDYGSSEAWTVNLGYKF